MRFELTAESQARFKRGLHATAQRLNKSSLDLLRQTAVYYAQAARKRTPGPWFNSSQKTRQFREVFKLSESEQAEFLKAGPLKRWPTYGVRVFVGQQPFKTPKIFAASSKRPKLARVKYRGAAQVSWSAMIKKMFHGSKLTDVFTSHNVPAGSGSMDRVIALGAEVREAFEGQFRPVIYTENKLGYIARLRPGISQEAILSAENRFANAYIRKIGKDLEAEFNK